MRAKLENPGCHFVYDVPDDLPAITGRSRRALALVIANLLDNAVKYTGDEKRIRLTPVEASGRVFISVTDNGIGLSRAERKNVFRQFYQVDQNSRAPAALRASASPSSTTSSEAHAGRVDIESQLGRQHLHRLDPARRLFRSRIRFLILTPDLTLRNCERISGSALLECGSLLPALSATGAAEAQQAGASSRTPKASPRGDLFSTISESLPTPWKQS